MKNYTVRANRNIQERKMLAFEGESQEVQYDFSPWEEDNGSVTSVVWSVENGQVSIGSESLASSIASIVLTTSESGESSIKLTATAGSNVFVTYLMVVCKDPTGHFVDYV